MEVSLKTVVHAILSTYAMYLHLYMYSNIHIIIIIILGDPHSVPLRNATTIATTESCHSISAKQAQHFHFQSDKFTDFQYRFLIINSCHTVLSCLNRGIYVTSAKACFSLAESE